MNNNRRHYPKRGKKPQFRDTTPTELRYKTIRTQLGLKRVLDRDFDENGEGSGMPRKNLAVERSGSTYRATKGWRKTREGRGTIDPNSFWKLLFRVAPHLKGKGTKEIS